MRPTQNTRSVEMTNKDFDFSDIAPHDDSVFRTILDKLIQDPGFLHAISYVMPKEEIPALIDELRRIDNRHDFQHRIMFPFLETLAKTTTST